LQTGQCIKCPLGQYKNTTNNICLNTCPAGSYANSTLSYCSTCDSGCLTCNGGSKINCVSCPTSGTTYNFLLLGMCVASTSCPLGTYADQSTYQCTSCPSGLNCSTCSNSTGTIVCSTCAFNSFMTSGGTCATSCASNQYANYANSSCVYCESSCATCYSLTNSSCLTCPSGKYLLNNSTGGYCIAACPSTLYFSQYTSFGVCLPCYATCLTCSGTLRSSKFAVIQTV
jgi:proprotein convertase subtilisin/kexin type 5